MRFQKDTSNLQFFSGHGLCGWMGKVSILVLHRNRGKEKSKGIFKGLYSSWPPYPTRTNQFWSALKKKDVVHGWCEMCTKVHEKSSFPWLQRCSQQWGHFCFREEGVGSAEGTANHEEKLLQTLTAKRYLLWFQSRSTVMNKMMGASCQGLWDSPDFQSPHKGLT